MDKWILKAYKYTRKRMPGFRSISQANASSVTSAEVVNARLTETSLKDMTPNKNSEADSVGSNTPCVFTISPMMSSSNGDTFSNFNDAYSLSEEIPVVGYASADDTSEMQVLNSDGAPGTTSACDGLSLAVHSREHVNWVSLESDAAMGNEVAFGIRQDPLQRDLEVRQLVLNSDELESVLQEDTTEKSKTASNGQSDPRAQLTETQINVCANSRASSSQLHRDRGHHRIRGSKSLDGYTDHITLKDASEMLNPNEIADERCGSSHDIDWDGLHSASVNDSSRSKRNSMTSDLGMCGRFVVDLDEPIHMTLEEVRSSLHSIKGMLEASSSATLPPKMSHSCVSWSESNSADNHDKVSLKLWGKRMHFSLCPKFRRTDAEHPVENQHIRCLPKSFKHTLCHWLGLAKSPLNHPSKSLSKTDFRVQDGDCSDSTQHASFVNRALPPVPQENLAAETEPCSEIQHGTLDGGHSWAKQDLAVSDKTDKDIIPDFAASIQKVKDCGWYWGPISGEMAEKILSNEPDGSFIVRDSSDEHYIFSLTFKLNGFVRHVRIEHDQGNFSFGTYKIFKSHTIVEFIESAVQHSRSGRYLFFLHRRPILGPMRVQLLHPVSRFKKVQSLQHMCRFIILKAVRRDHIDCLPLPARLKHYLNTPQYYAEQMQDWQTPSNRLAIGTTLLDNEY